MRNQNSPLVSRRGLLKGLGAGVGALALGAAARPFAARAQEMMAVSAINRFNVGDIAITMLQDGTTFAFPVGFMGVNAEEGEIAAINQASGLPAEAIFGGFNIALLEIGDQRILFDTGNGPAAQADGNGLLVPMLGLLGIAPETINGVIFSHFHPDHINGAVTDGALVFPNAVHYFPQPEYDFLQNATNVPADFAAIIDAANALLALLEESEQLELFAADAEVVPGVTSIFTPGHTPGHVALMVSSGDDMLLSTFDAAIAMPVSIANPDLYFGFDADPALAVETRRMLFGMAADEGIRVHGYHFPFPGVGYIAREGEGFRFTPAV